MPEGCVPDFPGHDLFILIIKEVRMPDLIMTCFWVIVGVILANTGHYLGNDLDIHKVLSSSVGSAIGLFIGIISTDYLWDLLIS